MDGGERSDGGGGEPEVEDEFTCVGLLRGSLASLHGTVERIFGVAFDIGGGDVSLAHNGLIWLKLQGQGSSVRAAKLFVKGVVNQEEQREVSYPAVLHCVFCGARGLFLDCLMRSTSAHIVVGSTGPLLISGLAEPVVRAYSLIADLVERYEGSQSGRSETSDRGSGESLDSRRAFKTLVEKWDDRHIVDLLTLPGSVKEVLLDLVKESGLGSNPGPAPTRGNAKTETQKDLKDRWDSGSDWWIEGTTAGSRKQSATKDSDFRSLATTGGSRGRAEGAEERFLSPQQDAMEEDQPEPGATLGAKATVGEKEEQELQFLLLLKFFTAMGYTEDVVKRVLARTGPREASQILDSVQQEQDLDDRRCSRDQNNQDAANQSERNQPCEMEQGDDEQVANKTGAVGGVCDRDGDGATGGARQFGGEGGAQEKEDGQEEDFVLGVVKKAAASCGYVEQEVAKVYNMLPDRSTHQLLLELQRDGGKEAKEAFRDGPRESDDGHLEKAGQKDGPAEGGARGEVDLFIPVENTDSGDRGWVALPKLNVPQPDLFTWIKKPQRFATNHYTPQPPLHQSILPQVKGPPMSTYSSSLHPPHCPSSLHPPHCHVQSNQQYGPSSHWSAPSTSEQTLVTQDNRSASPKPQQSSCSLKRALPPPQPSVFSGRGSSSSSVIEKRGVMAAASAASSVVVTREQRFLEGLQMPFELKLTCVPGDQTLRTVVIDASNVAMSHGLGHFFSCRGIALAVQHFWDRGHRNICALLPQWRQKSDARAKEQHYLGELQKLGMVSYTPSREVQGKRISSYDDRLILQLAEKTDGVIVTNDNLRDLSDESPVWRDIIKKRLLQYTFVGDHFMVPDDPLGRGGPHLDDFLRTPHPGNHSFTGVATTFDPLNPPHSPPEVLHFRNQPPGGAVNAGRGRGRGKGRKRDSNAGRQHRWVAGDRSPEETASLREQLHRVFAGQDDMVELVLQSRPAETDINVLSELILEQQND